MNFLNRPAAFFSCPRLVLLLAVSLLLVTAPQQCVVAQLLQPGHTVQAQHPIPTLQPPVAGYVFPDRQTLTFTVDWRVFTGGTAVFHLEKQGERLKVAATADTVGAVNMLFPVVDRFQSAMDTKTGCSEGFAKQVQEGRRKVSTDLMFDPKTGKQTQVEKNLVKGTQK